MFSDILRQDHERHGLSIDQAARRIGVSPVLYRKLEAGERWAELGGIRPNLGDLRVAADHARDQTVL